MDSKTYVVDLEEDQFGGRYVVHITPEAEAEMTFRKTEGNVIAVDHTFVPRSFRSSGIAEQLVNKMIVDVRETGTKVLPLCSYVVAQFRRHPEWSDLLAQ